MSQTVVLQQCEAIIYDEIQNLQKLYKAFEVIQEMELYKQGYENFSSYCTERWNINTTQVLENNLMLNFTKKDI